MTRNRFKEGWLILFLVVAMAVSPAAAIRWADWVPGLWVLQVISFLAVIAGVLLAKSQFSSGNALMMSLVYGIFTVGFFTGILLPQELPWHERIPQMIGRQLQWIAKAANVILDPDAADTSRDGLIFIMQTGFILWLIGYTASWYTFRQLRIWRAILPSAIMLLITVTNYYGPHSIGVVLVVFLILMLLYIVSSHYFIREQNWLRTRVVYNRDTRLGFLQTGFLIALLVTPLAWLMPSAPAGGALRAQIGPLDTTWQRIQDGWSQLFASLKAYGGEYSDPYGSTLSLGGPRQIESTPIMDLETISGRYLRGIVYDEFTGGGWVNTEKNELVVPPDNPLVTPRYSQRVPITATVTTYLANSGLIYTPHQPQGTDRQAKVKVVELGDGSYDIISTLSRFVLYEGQTYVSWGTASKALDKTLRQAGTSYPQWVQERYLQLPPDVSSRVVELAAAITAPHETPFDKAEALTNWLRNNLTYNEAVAAPPIDKDPLEYLLFESKEGYCNYYASALAVMLRSQGIPARIVAGYTQGNWLEDLGIYRVYSDNAHAWVEVFFPRYGWVEFEATTSQPAIIRSADAGADSAEDLGLLNDRIPFEEEPDQFDRPGMREGDPEDDSAGIENEGSLSPGLIIGGLALLMAIIAAVAFFISDRRRTINLSVVASIYDRMSRLAQWIGAQLLPTQTPYERATVLGNTAPDGAASIDVITDLYVEERFGQVTEGTYAERATTAWRELLPSMLRRGLLNTLSRFQRKKPAEKTWPERYR